MANFDSGVSSYIIGTCLIKVGFPVDNRARADVSCYQCPYYSRNSNMCQLNKEFVHYPQNHIGYKCPLNIEGEVEEDV